MNLIKTSFLNAIAVIVKMLALLGINKLLAIYVGPVGYATVGQFQNVIQFVTTFGTGAINTGVTKYTAEYRNDIDEQITLWKTAGSIVLISSFFLAILLFTFKDYLSNYLLHDDNYSSVFIFLALSLPFLALNTLFLAILNGKKEIKSFVIANIFGSILSIFAVYLLTVRLNLLGVLIALSTYQSFSFFITCLICRKYDWFTIKNISGSIDKKQANNLFKYSCMALVSAATVPLSQVAVRWVLINHIDSTHAGYWEAMWRLSSAYLMFITTTLGVYYLPRISEVGNYNEIKKEILVGYKLILPAVSLASLGVYLFRFPIVDILFTSQFYGMIDLFPYQLLGDLFKVGSWLLAFVMLSRAMVLEYIITQIICTISFPVLTYIIIGHVGFEGVAIAHFLNYSIYWVLVAYVINKRLRVGRSL
ncbi:Polysaccharide transporter, PST family [Vibrio chagasii]|nr:Polysaccharide transporter, PST family [Vibrio chagasii]